jgi:endogenous inhibitor of DNA gyrase (YacG/DUF329 family)
MERTKVFREIASCPYCQCDTLQRTTAVVHFPRKPEYERMARECLTCGRATKWVRGQMIYPTVDMLAAHERQTA